MKLEVPLRNEDGPEAAPVATLSKIANIDFKAC